MSLEIPRGWTFGRTPFRKVNGAPRWSRKATVSTTTSRMVGAVMTEDRGVRQRERRETLGEEATGTIREKPTPTRSRKRKIIPETATPMELLPATSPRRRCAATTFSSDPIDAPTPAAVEATFRVARKVRETASEAEVGIATIITTRKPAVDLLI